MTSAAVVVASLAGPSDITQALGAVLAFALPFTLVGALVTARVRGNAVGPLLLAVGWVSSLNALATAWARFGLVAERDPAPLAREAAWLADGTWWLPPAVCFTLLLLLFPTGRLPSPRWRPVVWMVGLGLALVIGALGVGNWPDRGSSYVGEGLFAYEAVTIPIAAAGAALILLAVPLSLTAAVIGFRRSRDVERAQRHWLVLGVVVAIAGTVVFTGPPGSVGRLLGAATFAAIPASLGVAMLRHRLYDIDLVVNRALLYGLLAAILAGAYLALAALLGAVLGGTATAARTVAAVAVALAAPPLRDVSARAANQLVYGRRHDQRALLGELTRRLADTTDPAELLDDLTATIAATMRFERVEVAPAETGPDGQHPARPPSGVTVPLRYGGLVIGALRATGRPPGDPVTERDRETLAALAGQVAGAVHALVLTRDLERSRSALVTAREEERRRLRRDLHDGVGPALAVVAMGIETAATHEGADQRALLDRLRDDVERTLADVRSISRSLRPPALDDLGLVGALEQLAATMTTADTAFTIEGDDLGFVPAAVEAAAYRIASEAMTNAARHAGAARCHVGLRRDGTDLVVEVTDNGGGLPDELCAGVGVTSMRERSEELGGRCTVARVPGGGTAVLAELPCTLPEHGSDGGAHSPRPQTAGRFERPTEPESPAEEPATL